jgi:hypothetical protein
MLTYTVLPATFDRLKGKLPGIGFAVSETLPNVFIATGHSVSLSVAYDPATQAATITLLKKMGFVKFASDDAVYNEIDAKIKAALAG